MSDNPLAPLTPYLAERPAGDTRPRLFCFPHAGGSASVYTALRNTLAPQVDVLPVQPPGRGRRQHEPMPDDMASYVADLDAHLDAHLSGPYAFYGHSMGALAAYDLATRRAGRAASTPTRLIVGASRAPHFPAAFATAHARPDDVLRAQMLAIGGLSKELLAYPEWVASALRLTRVDLRVCASRVHRRAVDPPWSVLAFHGAGDPMVTEDEVAGWAAYGRGGFALRRLPGGHFFLVGDASRSFAAHVADALSTPAGQERSSR